MSWARLDDQFWASPKVVDSPAEAIGLWTMGLSAVAQAGTDGVLSSWVAKDMAHRIRIKGTTAQRHLVKRGLWHDHRTIGGCTRCAEVLDKLGVTLKPGEFYVHDYLELNPASADVATPEGKWKEARKKRLQNDRELCDRIKERDRWCCRYCHRRVDFADHRTGRGGTYDHVDPSLRDNLIDWIVVACRDCNITKADRLPAEAGMVLAPLEEHVRTVLAAGIDSGVQPRVGSRSDRNPVAAGPDSPPTRESGRVGSGLNPGSSPRVEALSANGNGRHG
jgi:hypothetical protein